MESKKRHFGVRKRLATKKKSLILSSLVMFLDIEQFVLVPVSVCNIKSLNTPSVTKQKLPKYQFNQNPTYQIDSLRKEINKKLFAKAHFLINKILSFQRTKLSNSQTLILDGEETGVFFSVFAQQLRRRNADVPEIYFILLDAAGITP